METIMITKKVYNGLKTDRFFFSLCYSYLLMTHFHLIATILATILLINSYKSISSIIEYTSE